MNFDDLHDPHPPRPGSAALAAVTGRARRIRRRRAALVAAGGLVAVAAVVVPATLAVTGGDDEGGRLVPATVPDTTVLPGTTAAEATLPPPTAPQPTEPTSVLTTGVVAIHRNGDAVHIDAAGLEQAVFDGADPSEQPAEGELTLVDSVVRTPNGRTFVSTCCEPVPGSYVEIGADGVPIGDSLVYGHALALSPDGLRIASVGAVAITIADLDGNVLASADLTAEPEYRQPSSVMWLDDGTLAVIELRQPELDWWLYVTDADLTGVAAASGADLGGSLDGTAPHFGGVADDGSILVSRGQSGGHVIDRLEAYDPVTLVARAASDLALPDIGVDAWSRDGLLTWVGIDDVLWVDGIEVPGEFAWARPVG